MVIAFRTIVISLGLLEVCQGYDVSPDCWLGNEEFSVDLICPHYTGDGKIFCCGDQYNRSGPESHQPFDFERILLKGFVAPKSSMWQRRVKLSRLKQ